MSPLLRWFPSLDPTDRARPRLFCFPAAGGNTAMFFRWRTRLADQVQVVPVELPGHRNRLAEPLHRSIDPLVDELMPVLHEATGAPFALLGTSMGALIAFEAARRLVDLGVTPAHLIVASCPSPRTPRPDTVHRLPDADFLQELGRMEATPAEVLESPDLTALLLPAWRADFTLVETYAYRAGPRVTVPLTAVAAAHDRYAPAAEVLRWQHETNAAFSFVQVDAGHFFFLDAASPVLPDLVVRLPFARLKGSDAIY